MFHIHDFLGEWKINDFGQLFSASNNDIQIRLNIPLESPFNDVSFGISKVYRAPIINFDMDLCGHPCSCYHDVSSMLFQDGTLQGTYYLVLRTL
jgi:hypothetical protein